MIVRIHFKGTVGAGKDASITADFVDIHTTNTDDAKTTFLHWTRTSAGIRGSSGTFHPLDSLGTIKITKVVKQSA